VDKKSKVLISIFILIVAASVAATYYRYIVLKDIGYETDEDLFQTSLLEE
jgi:hypothetical protein